MELRRLRNPAPPPTESLRPLDREQAKAAPDAKLLPMWPASQQGALLVSGCELSSRPSFSRASGLGYRIDRSEPTRRFRGYGAWRICTMRRERAIRDASNPPHFRILALSFANKGVNSRSPFLTLTSCRRYTPPGLCK